MQDASWLSHRVMEKLAQTRVQQGTGPELSDLTTRERAVLECIAKGKNNEQIGEELNLAPSTVRNYVTNVYSKIRWALVPRRWCGQGTGAWAVISSLGLTSTGSI
jgi:DNA-binding NarL/FixJ family response regulator